MPIALLAVDINWFKAYNDTFGHPQGDQCLRRVAGTLRACLRRARDAAARTGGEEFVLILPNTNMQGAAAFGEKCRRAIETLGISHPSSSYGHVTVRIGISTIRPAHPRAAETGKELVWESVCQYV